MLLSVKMPKTRENNLNIYSNLFIQSKGGMNPKLPVFNPVFCRT